MAVATVAVAIVEVVVATLVMAQVIVKIVVEVVVVIVMIVLHLRALVLSRTGAAICLWALTEFSRMFGNNWWAPTGYPGGRYLVIILIVNVAYRPGLTYVTNCLVLLFFLFFRFLIPFCILFPRLVTHCVTWAWSSCSE